MPENNNKQISARRRIGFTIMLWVIGITVLLAACESIARYFIAGPIDFIALSGDPDLIYELRPGHYRVDGILFRIPEYDVAIDRNGCRVAALDTPAGDPHDIPVLLIGDSFTFGDGVSGSQTFPALIKTLLPGVRLINCGVPGYNLVQLARAAELRVAQFNPALSLILVYRNDLKGALRLERTPDAPTWLQWLRRHSRLFRLFYIMHGWFAGDLGRLQPLPVSAAEKALVRIARIASAHRTVLIILREPSHPQIQFLQETQRRGLRWYRTPPRFFDRSLQIPKNLHWTPEGQRRFAEWLAPLLAQELALSKSTDATSYIRR